MLQNVECGYMIRVCVQARQVLEREFNNLLALGTDRNLAEVSIVALSSLNRYLPLCILRPYFRPYVCAGSQNNAISNKRTVNKNRQA